MAATLSSA
jgi:hypothetical protein